MRQHKDREGKAIRSQDDGWQSLDAGDPYLESLTKPREENQPAGKPRGATPDPYLVELARQRRLLESGVSIDELEPEPESEDEEAMSSATGAGTLRSFALAL